MSAALTAAAVPAADFVQTSIDYAAVSPVLVVAVAALLGILVEAFVPRARRFSVQLTITLVALLGALAAILTCARDHQVVTAGGAVAVDGMTLLLQGALMILGIMAVLAMSERFDGRHADAFTQSGSSAPGSHSEAVALRVGGTTTEVFPLVLFSLVGMMLFPAANDLITMFVALEVLSLPLYVLCGLARRRRLLSQEASLKYFLLGAFSSAFYLFGAALLYGFSGSLRFSGIRTAIAGTSPLESLLVPGIFFVLVGLLFKIGAVPFHSWTPDVYQGAPTPVSGYMAACTKLAAFGAALRFVYVAAPNARWDYQAALWVVAALTMVVGAVLTVTQTDMKRLLAYSSIAHAGFVLVGLLAFDREAVAGVAFYVIAYAASTIAAFGVISLVRENGSEATAISQWAGLGRRSPLMAGVFAFLLASFAGIPLTSGFISKFAAFKPAVSSGGTVGVVLVVLGVLCSAVTAYAYFRVVAIMFSSDAATTGGAVAVHSVNTMTAIAAGTVITLLLGVLPGPLLDLAAKSSLFLP